MKFILMDVEGTTTSIRFVHDTLFPYSYEKMDSYIAEHPEVGVSSDQLKAWIKADKKEPILKSVQGKIWEEGYKNGELKGHIYSDVPKAFERWLDSGLKLGIYSSGSVLAQKLLFKHSDFGDLDQYISANFDTSVGHKREKASYENIAQKLKFAPNEILFLSDIEEELDAAAAAGFQVARLLRDEALPSKYKTYTSFELV